MASKRKSEPVKKTVKRGKKKTDDSFDSDLSDDYGDEAAGNGNGNAAQLVTFDERAVLPKLPEELLASRDREPGQLLIAGMITWDIVGKRADAKGGIKIRPNLWNFHRFGDEKYRRIVSGCASAHSVLVNMDRKVLTFGKLQQRGRSFHFADNPSALGRNNFAQLGQPELKTYEKPTLVPGLEGFNIIDAACGRNHTLFLTDTGLVYSCGDNKSGQCGVGTSTAMITKATRINYTGPPIIKVGCGAEFSVILDVKGNLHTFGLPEYGQLGHNTDGKYFITSSKMSFHFELSPKRVPLYIEKAKDGHVTPVDDVQIVDFACGNNHTVAIDSKKRAYSWGFGGVGRLGHAEQKDEMVPRLIKFFDSSNRGVRRVFCGSSFTLVSKKKKSKKFNLLIYCATSFRPFPIKDSCTCLARTRRLEKPTCTRSPSRILQVSKPPKFHQKTFFN